MRVILENGEMMEEYQVKIDTFESTLDLLLHLINRLEIDIYDIPVAKITEQYLLYVHTMRVLEPRYGQRVFGYGCHAAQH